MRGNKYKPTVAFPGEGENERPLAQALSAARAAKDAADAAPFATGALSSGLTFTTGQVKRVPHGLGRRPVGWLVTYATGSAPVLFATVSDAQYITLTHSGASTTTCNIYFF